MDKRGKQFLTELKELLAKYNAIISCDILGDISGIYDEKMRITMKEEKPLPGNRFCRDMDIFSCDGMYLTANDIEL